MYIKIKAEPNAKKDELLKLKEDTFRVRVRAKPERNLANESIAGLLAGHFGVSIGKIKLVSGHHSPSKIFDVKI